MNESESREAEELIAEIIEEHVENLPPEERAGLRRHQLTEEAQEEIYMRGLRSLLEDAKDAIGTEYREEVGGKESEVEKGTRPKKDLRGFYKKSVLLASLILFSTLLPTASGFISRVYAFPFILVLVPFIGAILIRYSRVGE